MQAGEIRPSIMGREDLDEAITFFSSSFSDASNSNWIIMDFVQVVLILIRDKKTHPFFSLGVLFLQLDVVSFVLIVIISCCCCCIEVDYTFLFILCIGKELSAEEEEEVEEAAVKSR